MLNLKLKNKQIKLQKNRKKLLTIFKKINKYWNVFFILILKIISSKLVIFLTNYLKKKLKKNKNKTKYWIRLKLKKTITYKPINLRMGKGKGLIVGSFFFLKPFNSVLEFKNVRFGFFNQLFRKFKFKISNNMCYLVSNFCKNIFKKKKKTKKFV